MRQRVQPGEAHRKGCPPDFSALAQELCARDLGKSGQCSRSRGAKRATERFSIPRLADYPASVVDSIIEQNIENKNAYTMSSLPQSSRSHFFCSYRVVGQSLP
jgi:hypothetical protein